MTLREFTCHFHLLVLMFVGISSVVTASDSTIHRLNPPTSISAEFVLNDLIYEFRQSVTGLKRHLSILDHGTPILADDGKLLFSPGIVVLKNIDGKWSDPEYAHFSGIHVDINPTISPSGERLYFFRSFEVTGGGEEGPYFVERKESNASSYTWTEPKKIAQEVFSQCNSYQVSESKDRSLYFGSSDIDDGFGMSDIYMSAYVDGRYTTPLNLGSAVNSDYRDSEPFISPKGDYLIFMSDRKGGFGKRDLYICFRKEDGSWTRAVNMGGSINSSFDENWPNVSADGRILFFRSNRESTTNMRIFWIGTQTIEDLRTN